MIPNKVEIQTQEGNKLIEGVLKGVINSPYNSIGLDILIRVLLSHNGFVQLQHHRAKNEHQH